jgi:hypothetical protein
MLAGYAVDEPHWEKRSRREILFTHEDKDERSVFGLSVAVIKVAVGYEL